jgi:hypothetical protein
MRRIKGGLLDERKSTISCQVGVVLVLFFRNCRTGLAAKVLALSTAQWE